MEKPEQSKAERIYAKLGRGANEDIETIRAAILSAVEEEREAIQSDVQRFKDLDGSTGEEYDSGYEDAFQDALTAIRNRKGA